MDLEQGGGSVTCSYGILVTNLSEVDLRRLSPGAMRSCWRAMTRPRGRFDPGDSGKRAVRTGGMPVWRRRRPDVLEGEKATTYERRMATTCSRGAGHDVRRRRRQ